MKRIGDLYDLATSEEALYQGCLDARRGKRARHACHQFERSLGSSLAELQALLASRAYRPDPYRAFMVYEPKPRQISAPSFRDRVVQHAVYNAIRPIFDRSFIDQSFACRPGRGTHAAADYVQHSLSLSAPGSYTLHLDVRRFYYSIDREILLGQLQRKIKDADLLRLMMAFTAMPEPLGLPIGNLLSQLFALVYLNPLDHYIKRELKVSRYCRYVDDLVLLDLSRDQAEHAKAAVERYLREELHLQLSKATMAPSTRGVNFAGYRTWASRRFVRRHALRNFRLAVRRGDAQAVMSSLGHARKSASHSHLINHLKEHWHALSTCLPPGHRRLDHAPLVAA